MTVYYTGVGSRKTPADIQENMRLLAKQLAEWGWVLRSGGTSGADTAFEQGCDEVNGPKEIFLPWKRFNKNNSPFFPPKPIAYDLARSVNLDRFDYLKPAFQHLLARNAHQVEGWDFNEKSKFLVCWTPDECNSIETRTKRSGGTGTTIAIAFRLGIPIFNLRSVSEGAKLMNFLDKLRYGDRIS